MTSSHILVLIALLSGVNCNLISPVPTAFATSTNFIVFPTATVSVMPSTNYTDHCLQGTDNCTASLAQCTTTAPGSYICVCNAGYSGNGQGQNGCEDINECTNGQHTCHQNATCTNINGTFTCACNSGFTGNGTDCKDLRICGNSGNICHENATCQGSTCVCNAGYTGNGVTCTDIDECKQNICYPNATCTNLEGSYHCTCPPNLSGNGIQCSDACSYTTCPSQSTCYVFGNVSECTCDRGRFLKTNNNGVQECVLAEHLVSVRGLRLLRQFIVQYYNINSTESRELLREVEAAVYKILSAFFNRVVAIQGERIYPGSTMVDFISLVTNNGAEPAPSSTEMEEKLLAAVRNNSLANIQADPGSNITVNKTTDACTLAVCTQDEICQTKPNSTFECLCKDAFFRVNGTCLRKSAYRRGELSFTYKKIWDADLTNVASEVYSTTTKTLENQISTSLQSQLPSYNNAYLYFEVNKYSQRDRFTAVTGSISYLNQGLSPEEQKNLCNALRTFKYSGNSNEFEAYSFISYECCYPNTFGEQAFKGIYSYDTILRSTSASKLCVYNNQTSFQRSCLGNGNSQAKWEDVESLPLCKAFTKTTEELIELDQTNVCSSNQTFGCASVVETAQNLSAVVSSGEKVSNSEDVKSVGSIFTKIVENVKVNETAEIITDLINTVSNVMDAEPIILKKAEERSKSATQILQNLNDFAKKLGDTIAQDQEITQSSPNIGVRVSSVSPKNFSLVVELDQTSNISLTSTKSDSSTYKGEVIIPESTFQSYPGGFEGKVYAYVFKNQNLFVGNATSETSETSETKTEVQGVIVSVKLGDKKVTGDPAVRLKFTKDSKYNQTGTSLCSYWKIDKNDSTNSRWDQAGCSLESEVGQVVTCACNHFTHFAILLNLFPIIKSLVLDVVSYIGCGLSLVGLIFTIIAHAFNRIIRKRLSSKILVCFAISLSMVLILFLAGINSTDDKVGCQVVAGLLMYFMLTTFVWMGVIAISLYQLIVLVFKRNDTKFFVRANFAAWGLPAIIVIVTGAVSPERLAPIKGTKDYCFVDGYPFYFGVVMPVCIILFMNIMVLIYTMARLYRTTSVNANHKQVEETMSQSRIAFGCSILLGVTWVLGLFAVGDLSFTVQLLFCIFNAFQGFFIFVLYTLMNPIIRADIRSFCRCGPVRESFSTSGQYAVTGASNAGISNYGEIAYSTTS